MAGNTGLDSLIFQLGIPIRQQLGCRSNPVSGVAPNGVRGTTANERRKYLHTVLAEHETVPEHFSGPNGIDRVDPNRACSAVRITILAGISVNQDDCPDHSTKISYAGSVDPI